MTPQKAAQELTEQEKNARWVKEIRSGNIIGLSDQRAESIVKANLMTNQEIRTATKKKVRS